MKNEDKAPGRARGRRRRSQITRQVLLEYVKERVADRTDIVRDRIFLVHTRCDPAVVESVRAAPVGYGFQDIYEATAGCTISSHCGPNTLGIIFLRNA